MQKQDPRTDPETCLLLKPDIRGDFDAIRAGVEELRNLENRERQARMDISAAAEKETEWTH